MQGAMPLQDMGLSATVRDFKLAPIVTGFGVVAGYLFIGRTVGVTVAFKQFKNR
jgi:hypothetical protein